MKLIHNPTKLIIAGFLFTTISVISCNKETSADLTAQEEEQASQISSESDAEAEIVFNDVFDDVIGTSDEVGLAGTGIFGRTRNSIGITGRVDSACFIVTITYQNLPNYFPVHI
ncbi:MAG: hypothetical protein M3O67_06635, partial [Bacteroidota bacterium]|nr:hypothetical protein [Bacteroidota bacterium]